MKIKTKINLSIILVLAVVFSACAQPKIIIKLDDLGARNGVPSCKPVLDLLLQRKIKVGLGVIAMRLDSSAARTYSPYIHAVNDKGEPLFEFWNHGYDHSDKLPPSDNFEFKGTPLAFQIDHLRKSDERVEMLLGIKMHTFGAPYNLADSICIQALEQRDNYRNILFGNPSVMGGSKLVNLNNRVNMESATGVVNYEYFLTQYQQRRSRFRDVMVVQGHPNQWDAERLSEFAKILDFLTAEHCEFVLPDVYSQTLKKSHN
jgi:peptidoglycan/xylan/chitin deacetylase (PgdA/CDA1 family)